MLSLLLLETNQSPRKKLLNGFIIALAKAGVDLGENGIAQAKREAGYRNIGGIEGITTSGDALSRTGLLRKVKSYDPL